MNPRKSTISYFATLAVAACSAHGAVIGQLGVLDSATGLNPGDQYRLVFITSGTTDAQSADIGTYNTFVTSQAAASTTYTQLGDANWLIIGSTVAVDARDNTSTNPTVDGLGVPIFLVDGTTQVAASNNDFWDNNIANAINIDQSGNTLNVNTFSSGVFTGSFPNGTSVGPDTGGDTALGVDSTPAGISGVQTGTTEFTDTRWARAWKAGWDQQRSVYAMSEVLTAVPEPSSAMLAGLGGLILLRRRRK